jgi:biotin synthase
MEMIRWWRLGLNYKNSSSSVRRKNEYEPWRSGHVLCGANSIFAGDKLLPLNPDVNDDMEMFEMLGLTPLKTIYKSFSAYYSWGCELSIYHTWRKPKWSRPGHY